ncbi:MAG TPA: ABC transporter ATP-binding protein [Polyangia bacterium]
MTALLAVEDLEVAAGRRALLRVAALAVREGEVLAVIGATGAGKTTLLTALHGLARPARGRFSWRGAAVPVPLPIAVRRRIAMVFQDPLLLHGTVHDNVAYGLRLRGVARAAVDARVGEALRGLHVEALAARPVARLSGGEAQRVALARAVVLRPDLLLLDEPLASLDPGTRERIAAELRAVIRAAGLTCVHVTHDQEEAQAVGDRIAVIDEGRLAQLGAPEEVFLRPATARVAALVRTRNLLPGEVVAAAGGETTVSLGPHRIAVAAGAPPGPVLVCVRPEAVTLAVAPGARNALPGVVVAARPAGALVELTLDCGGVSLVALAARAAAAAPGTKITAVLAPGAVHLIPDGG